MKDKITKKLSEKVITVGGYSGYFASAELQNKWLKATGYSRRLLTGRSVAYFTARNILNKVLRATTEGLMNYKPSNAWYTLAAL